MYRTSLVLNILITVLTILGLYLTLSGTGKDQVLSSKNWKAFRYFTVDSNVFMGLISAVCAVLEFSGKKQGKVIPLWGLVLLMTATAAVTVTLITVVVFLAPTCKKGYLAMFRGGNFLFHLIIPLLAVADFIVTARGRMIPFRSTLLCLAPVLLYGTVYSINVFSHLENGRTSEKYDWYGFATKGVKSIGVTVPVMVSGTFLIAVLLWLAVRA